MHKDKRSRKAGPGQYVPIHPDQIKDGGGAYPELNLVFQVLNFLFMSTSIKAKLKTVGQSNINACINLLIETKLYSDLLQNCSNAGYCLGAYLHFTIDYIKAILYHVLETIVSKIR